LSDDMLSSYDEANLQSRIKYVEALNANFNAAQTRLEKLDLLELAADTRANFYIIFFDLEAKLLHETGAHRRRSSNAHFTTPVHNYTCETTANGSHRKWRLPNLPHFSCKYADCLNLPTAKQHRKY